jgi:hypothetical protein|mmetsp:Transcript_4423/g.16370  ORF Transcript_4423/g.16370 Transcript_4423/m.16370 type:complete len:159 (-) Transcript_4423:6023-6499(-)
MSGAVCCVSPRLAAAPVSVRASASRGHARVTTCVTARAGTSTVSFQARHTTGKDKTRGLQIVRSGDGETDESAPKAELQPPVKSDPFGFGSGSAEPDKIQPGFDTAEGGKVGPVGTFFITVLLVFLFGASFFFTSVPRNAIEGFVDLSDDPNAPTQRF